VLVLLWMCECVSFIHMCCLRGRVSVSPCMCCIVDACVQPVAIRSAVICSFWMCVSAVSGRQAGCAYEGMGLMYLCDVLLGVTGRCVCKCT